MVLNAFFVEERNDSFKLNLKDFSCVRLRRAKIPVEHLHFSSADIKRKGQNIDLPTSKMNMGCNRLHRAASVPLIV